MQFWDEEWITLTARFSAKTKEALNLRMLLEHMGFGDPLLNDIYVDSKGEITMGLHPVNKPSTRHVNMRMHMLCHHVELGHVCTPFAPLLTWWQTT